MQIVDITEAGPLLDAVYSDVLTPAFPPAELVTVDSLRESLTDGDAGIAAVLDDQGAPAAAAVVDYSAESGLLLLSYLAVRPGVRGGGYGGTLLAYAQQELLRRFGATALLAELEHPTGHVGNDDHGDPVARLRFYARYGGRALDLPYFQPALGPGSERVYGMILAVLATADGVTATTMPAEPVRLFLRGYVEGSEGAIGDDPALAALWRMLDRPDGVPLLELTEAARIPLSTKDGPIAAPIP